MFDLILCERVLPRLSLYPWLQSIPLTLPIEATVITLTQRATQRNYVHKYISPPLLLAPIYFNSLTSTYKKKKKKRRGECEVLRLLLLTLFRAIRRQRKNKLWQWVNFTICVCYVIQVNEMLCLLCFHNYMGGVSSNPARDIRFSYCPR